MSKYDYLHALYQALLTLDSAKRDSIMREIEDKFRKAEEEGLSEIHVTNELGLPEIYAQQFTHQNVIIRDVSLTLDPNPIQGTSLSYDVSDDLTSPSQHEETSPITESTSEINDNSITPIPENTKKYVYISPQKSNIQNFQKQGHNPIQMILISFGMAMFNLIFILGPFLAIWGVVFGFVTTGLSLSISGLFIILSGIFSFPISLISLPLVIMGHPILLFSSGFLILGVGGLLTIATIYMIRFFGIATAKYVQWNIKLIRGY